MFANLSVKCHYSKMCLRHSQWPASRTRSPVEHLIIPSVITVISKIECAKLVLLEYTNTSSWLTKMKNAIWEHTFSKKDEITYITGNTKWPRCATVPVLVGSVACLRKRHLQITQQSGIYGIIIGWIFNKAKRSLVNLLCRGHSSMVIILYLLIRVIIITTALLFRVMSRNLGFIYC